LYVINNFAVFVVYCSYCVKKRHGLHLSRGRQGNTGLLRQRECKGIARGTQGSAGENRKAAQNYHSKLFSLPQYFEKLRKAIFNFRVHIIEKPK